MVHSRSAMVKLKIEVIMLKVLTVTLNPALDRELFIESFKVDKLHRVVSRDRMSLSPGGKGINVSVALAKLGVPSIATGFLGGYMGRILLEELRKVSNLITTNFVFIRDETRENIAIIDEASHTITEINSPGPEVEERDIEHILRRYSMSLARVEAVVISGSIPSNAPKDIYVKMVRMAKEKGLPVFMEIRDPHISTLFENDAMPDVIKPDFRAKHVLLGRELETLEDFITGGRELLRAGAKLAVLSYFIDKDVLVTDNEVAVVGPTVEIDYSHLLGTGDTYVAAMVYKYLMGERDMLEIGKYGYVAALAKTKKAKKEMPSLDEINEFMKYFKFERVG